MVVLAYNSQISWWIVFPSLQNIFFTTSSRFTSSLDICIHQHNFKAKKVYIISWLKFYGKYSLSILNIMMDCLSPFMDCLSSWFFPYIYLHLIFISIIIISWATECIHNLMIEMFLENKVDGSLSIYLLTIIMDLLSFCMECLSSLSLPDDITWYFYSLISFLGQANKQNIIIITKIKLMVVLMTSSFDIFILQYNF